ncbi:MAG: site-2 protease family protein [Candidatus Levybacteria bacterium CG_4_9_14_3_um_filter_35_16]|nr:MAG: site-2 protease family protein [Candidatus Levybacteria bacterium CG_4_10_14_0_8_um_filter_35_23]PJA91513.1 MAG: site-2 protease family protein [Candidatus Levybacteria bacterium CG_4_9_14_3_um_filter_35_16]
MSEARIMFLSGLITVVILVFSAILHEIAHGFVADRLGDPTARLLGRLTLNPRNHIDPVMSILLPLLLIFSGSPVIFGAAKPVPVDPFNLKEGRKDLAIVSLAGPLTNVIIAIIAGFIIKFSFIFGSFAPIAEVLLLIVVQINLLLAIFNLLPIPPLDGSKIFSLLLPEKEANAYMSLGSVGFMILFFLLMFPVAGFSLGEVIFSLLTFSEKLLGL